jgi:hypothetical protein
MGPVIIPLSQLLPRRWPERARYLIASMAHNLSNHRRGRPQLSLSGELLQRLLTRLEAQQAKEALGDDWPGWWPDDNDGGGDDSPFPQQPLPEPA